MSKGKDNIIYLNINPTGATFKPGQLFSEPFDKNRKPYKPPVYEEHEMWCEHCDEIHYCRTEVEENE